MKVKSQHFKIGLFNAGSLGTRHDEFLVAMSDIKVQLMIINETWLREGEEALAPQVPGYRLLHSPRPPHIKKGRGGGVGFYIKKGIKFTICDHPNPHLVEQMWLSLKVGSKTIMVGTAYRPPWQDVNLFIDSITQSLTLFSSYDNIILLGDFNINLLSPTDSKTKLFNDFLSYINLKQIVTEPTHFTDHSETLIDLVCTNASTRDVKVHHIKELGSHAIITFQLNFKKADEAPRWITLRPLKDISAEDFNGDLNKIPWNDINCLNDVEDMVSLFNAHILTLFDIHAPTKRIQVKDQSCPWITYTIKKMIKLRNQSHSRYKTSKTESHKEYYKNFKKLVCEAIEAEKCAYFNTHINQCINKPLLLWKNLKKNVGLNKKQEYDISATLCDPEKINNHFLDIPHSMNSSLSKFTFYEFNRFGPDIFSIKTITEAEVIRVLKGLKSNAQGLDEITLQMVHWTLPQSLSTITAITNRSIATSTFPNAWKTAIVKPLPKVSNPASLKDLRPISILPCVSKVLEKLVCAQMTSFVEEKKILPKYQSGFRKCHSTATALMDVIDNILTAQDQGMGTILVLLDFSRAFDSIDTTLLLSKLSYYGFSTATINWCNSFVTNRAQFVQIDQDDGTKLISTTSPVLRGVPQGSALSPLLFAIYTADITDCFTHCKYHLYADDVQLYYSFMPQDAADAEIKINEDLKRIANWSEKNSLLLNPLKSKYMILGTAKITKTIASMDPQIRIGNNCVERVSEAKNLGVIIDSNLHFESYISSVVRNCFYRLKVLYKIRSYLSVEVKVRLCDSLILSKLNYADTAYGPCLLERTKKLIQRVQNACARFCFPIAPRSHISPFINKANLLNMSARRNLHLATLLFGVVSTGNPEYLFAKIRWARQHSRYAPRGSACQLAVPRHRTVAFRGSFRLAFSKIWNIIPPPVQNLKSKLNFKSTLKKLLLDKQKQS